MPQKLLHLALTDHHTWRKYHSRVSHTKLPHLDSDLGKALDIVASYVYCCRVISIKSLLTHKESWESEYMHWCFHCPFFYGTKCGASCKSVRPLSVPQLISWMVFVFSILHPYQHNIGFMILKYVDGSLTHSPSDPHVDTNVPSPHFIHIIIYWYSLLKQTVTLVRAIRKWLEKYIKGECSCNSTHV